MHVCPFFVEKCQFLSRFLLAVESTTLSELTDRRRAASVYSQLPPHKHLSNQITLQTNRRRSNRHGYPGQERVAGQSEWLLHLAVAPCQRSPLQQQ